MTAIGLNQGSLFSESLLKEERLTTLENQFNSLKEGSFDYTLLSSIEKIYKEQIGSLGFISKISFLFGFKQAPIDSRISNLFKKALSHHELSENYSCNLAEFFDAAEKGEYEKLKFLIGDGTGRFREYLGEAAARVSFVGEKKCLRLLVEKCSKISESDAKEAILNAVRGAHKNCLKLLLKSTLKLSEATLISAISLATEKGDLNSLKLLIGKCGDELKQKCIESSLCSGLNDQSYKCLEYLLSSSSTISEEIFSFACSIASSKGKLRSLQLLLSEQSLQKM